LIYQIEHTMVAALTKLDATGAFADILFEYETCQPTELASARASIPQSRTSPRAVEESASHMISPIGFRESTPKSSTEFSFSESDEML
jgi:hypothetical protein